jgi:glycosyltransferase involved in cell wall biosynthesis
MNYSIITVNYNNKDGLIRTIESVEKLNYTDFEYIIIDGGSTDGSVDIIREHEDVVTYWISQKDNGIYNAMNKGIDQAKGDYVNFMNSGDTFYDPDVLKKVDPFLNGNDLIIGKEFHQDSKSGKTATTFLPSRISMATFFSGFLPHQSGFIRRSLLGEMPYDENLRIVSDWKFYMIQVVYNNCSIKLIDTIISRREQGGISNSDEELNKKERRQILTHILPPGVLKDYDSLAKLDKTTLFKLLNLCDDYKSRTLLTYSIKVINRIRKFLR